MTKTPEELADEYVQAWWGPREDNMTLATRQSFLAGYQAAKKSNSPEKPDGWISVKDRLPEERKHILWCHEPTQEIAVGYLLRADIKPYFTHWMPLPKPPEE